MLCLLFYESHLGRSLRGCRLQAGLPQKLIENLESTYTQHWIVF